MPKYDKYDPIAGGFRALLQGPLPLIAGGFFGAVSLNASGRVVPGTGAQSGLVGVLVKNVARGPIGRWDTSLDAGVPNPAAPIGASALDVVDIMTAGHIVDLDPEDFPAGRRVYAAADGTISTTAAQGSIQIGHTVKAGSLIVRFGYAPTAAPAV